MGKLFRVNLVFLLFITVNLYPSVSGYLKLNAFYLDYLNETSFVQLARFRFRFEESFNSFSFKLHSEINAINHGERYYSLFTGTILDELDPYYFYKGKELKIYHFFDRLSLTYNSEKFILTVGRQRIPWGKAKLFSPLDIFNLYNPFAIEKEEKQGVNSLRFEYYFSGFSWIEGAFARREGKNYFGTALFFSFGSVDSNLVIASLPEETLIGGALEGSSGRTVLRAELALRKKSNLLLKDISLGADFQLSSKIYLTGEYFSTDGSEFYPKGKVLVLAGDYKISDLSTIQLSYFHASPGNGNFFFLRFLYSWSSNFDVYIGFLYSSSGSSLWQFPKIAYTGSAFYY
ncbi:hypothetical protein NLC26_00535 [Candidatus Aminicenantes bacterium AC-708-M15]|jgi:hypothetical protein|nr:hypothetical protein [SCandidatus Aminicenantes bacterium Aminicenantia_JdfR_composite]MCP2596647.1 hypothetical protein [Candidatus Aminicenantes bacterium AC-335-G13]MCP2598218.1 hypothetical protein [Candidatus Aminicenantes bacterium AC-335-L06]MCP2603949.1 hypothetical protein [Candidatus Aminicenantes bacterium AC-708-M15]MCP2605595.1 hypothetical protein [Candidatus Aminicenantes bacterium AC-335-O07]MCP2606636.1 hypothetical protein [Candidatus Aminicenantes bacterium AC-708-I09]MC